MLRTDLRNGAHDGRKPNLRVGLLLDGLEVAAWQRSIVADLAAASWVDVPVAIVCWSPGDRQKSWLQNLLAGRLHRTSEIYDLYERVNPPNRPYHLYSERAPIIDLLEKTDLLEVVPDRRNRVYDWFSDADLARVAAYDLDVLIRFGFRILKGGILTLPRQGVWSFHHGDPAHYRGGPSCFWELVHGERTVGVVLQRLSEDLDAGQVLYRSTSSCPPTLWVERVRDAHFRKSSRFVLRCLERLHRTGDARVSPAPDPPARPAGRIYRRPGNLAATALLARLAARTALNNLINLARDSEWSILLRTVPGSADSGGKEGAVIGHIGGRAWQAADPCLHRRGDEVHCFFERMPRRGSTGEIAAVRVLADGRITEAKSVVVESGHLSYPFVFDWQGECFLLAESAEAGGIGVWEARHYPLVWRRRDTWLPGARAYDPTLLAWKGLWYLFVTIDEAGGGANDELFLFVADTPLGPWSPHAANPVVSDCRFARPAGGLFMQGDALIRPAQDCSGAYGRAINLCAVDALSPDEFQQRVVGRIEPPSVGGSIGCHTLSRLGAIEAIDLRRMRPGLGFLRASAGRG